MFSTAGGWSNGIQTRTVYHYPFKKSWVRFPWRRLFTQYLPRPALSGARGLRPPTLSRSGYRSISCDHSREYLGGGSLGYQDDQPHLFFFCFSFFSFGPFCSFLFFLMFAGHSDNTTFATGSGRSCDVAYHVHISRTESSTNRIDHSIVAWSISYWCIACSCIYRGSMEKKLSLAARKLMKDHASPQGYAEKTGCKF